MEQLLTDTFFDWKPAELGDCKNGHRYQHLECFSTERANNKNISQNLITKTGSASGDFSRGPAAANLPSFFKITDLPLVKKHSPRFGAETLAIEVPKRPIKEIR